MRKFYSFPDIQQFRNVIANVNYRVGHIGDGELDDTIALPVLKYTGTVKLHGTNAGVCYNNIDKLYSQSRNSIIDVDNDNAGFAKFVEDKQEIWIDLIVQLSTYYDIDLNYNTICVFCEWIGEGIQKGVAISKIEKSAIIIGSKVVPFDENLKSYWISTCI